MRSIAASVLTLALLLSWPVEASAQAAQAGAAAIKAADVVRKGLQAEAACHGLCTAKKLEAADAVRRASQQKRLTAEELGRRQLDYPQGRQTQFRDCRLVPAGVAPNCGK